MKLHTLLDQIEVLALTAEPDLEITGVSYDSRKVQPGDLFVAVTGFAADGNRFIPMALEKGAAAVVSAQPPRDNVPWVQVPSDRVALAALGGNWYGHPAREMQVIGVTGTNGKTSVTTLLKALLEDQLGAKVGLIGTVGNCIGNTMLPTERTTPESFELQGLLRQMADAGCTHVIMEVSSHALALERVGGIRFDVAAFTNLTEDHLDFHKTMDAYAEAKALLFGRCGKAVINVDDDYAPRMVSAAQCPVCTTSVHDEAQLTARNVTLFPDRVEFSACYDGETVPVALGIPGQFTVYNALTVLGIGLQLGLTLAQCAAGLAKAKGVPGRVEVVPTPGMDFTVLIDYAHTPDGLENVLNAARVGAKGRLISVFGCGGDRDPMKRPIMGRIGVELSDLAIITSDNPRTEDPMSIVDQIVKGIPIQCEHYVTICDRRQAIAYALGIARAGDVIVLAGKGHETYQEVNGVKRHLDEREEVAAWLAAQKEANGL